MKDPHINFKEIIESLIDEIKKEVEIVFKPGREKIREEAIKELKEITQNYGKDVEESKGGLGTYQVAIIIEDIIDSWKSPKKLDKWLLAYKMFTLGELSMYLSINIGKTETPISVMKRHRSLMGKLDRIKGWKPKREAIHIACKKAEKRWLEWKKEDGSKIFHNKMAEILLEEMPELEEQKITKPMLMEDLKEVARKIDPSLIWGWNP